MSGSGNGADNAHNNQFGGGGRGPTGGVNTGSGNSGGNGGDRGAGYWSLDPNTDTNNSVTYGPDGQVRINITKGMNWVSDNSIHWSDGKGGNGNDNLRTNVTAKVDNGYRAAVDGFIYMVAVNGNNDITAVSLYSRPSNSSRKDWAKNDSLRIDKAKFLVQTQLNILKANAELEAQKAAEAKAAAQAKRQADEEARRKQAEWDAAHPVEAAQRIVNETAEALRISEQSRNVAQNNYNAANNTVNQRQAEYNQAVQNEAFRKQEFDKVNNSNYANAPPNSGPGRLFRDMYGAYQSAKQNSENKKAIFNAAISERVVPENNLNNANAAYNSALTQSNNAQSALVNAKQDAKAKQDAETRRQAEAATKLKADNDAEAKRQADAAAKAKIAAETATKAAALEAAMSMLEQPKVFAMSGFPAAMTVSTAPIAFAETGLGSLVLGDIAAASAWTAVRSVIADLIGTIISGSGIGALIASVTYIPTAGEGSDKVPGRGDINMFLSAMPADAIQLPAEKILNTAAASQGTVDLAVRGRVYFDDKTFKTYLVRTTSPTPVRVLSAVRDSITGLYSVTIPAESELPSRTILVSPDKTPGYKGLPPLVTPQQASASPNNTGNQSPVILKPLIESFPMADDLDFRDAILVFPAETGMKPIYVMLQSGRDLPGTVEGKGQKVDGSWLERASKELGAPIPSQIADKLRGREFSSFDAFRKGFWIEIGRDPNLLKQFNPNNQELIRNGFSPFPQISEQVGGRVKFELHHIKMISQGGDVYNVDNIGVVTPKKHIEIHSNEGGK